MNALEIKNLSKSFGEFQLDHINLTLPSGCVMGLIGKNGAGKSTLIRLILGILQENEGSVTILGRDGKRDIRLIKEDIGVVLDEAGIPACLNARQVGIVMKHTFCNWDEDEYARLLKKLSLSDNKPFQDFSRGMKMKLGIAIAMSHHAKLLILDEATNGLDPVVRDEVVEMLNDFTADEDHSILISSHIVSDLEKISDYVAFLHNGKLLLCEEKDRLLDRYGMVHCTTEQLTALPADAVVYKKETPYGAAAMVLREKLSAEVNYSPVTLEELFLYMVKEEN